MDNTNKTANKKHDNKMLLIILILIIIVTCICAFFIKKNKNKKTQIKDNKSYTISEKDINDKAKKFKTTKDKGVSVNSAHSVQVPTEYSVPNDTLKESEPKMVKSVKSEPVEKPSEKYVEEPHISKP